LVDEIPGLPRNDIGLIEVDYSGLGLMIMKREVLESLNYPWFKSWEVHWKNENGEECADIETDDIGFCKRVRKNGYKVFIDPECFVGHEKKVIL
jgi:hypothetical protein